MTPIDYIRLALKTASVEGVGQTPDAEDVQDVFVVLQAMLAQWARKRWLVPNEVDTSLTATGATSYTIGPNGDFDMTRPDRIEAAYVRLLPYSTANQQIDIGLGVLDAHEDWAMVPAKSIVGFPQLCFLDTAYPLATLYVNPVPMANSCEIHLITKNIMPQNLTLTTDLALPPEFEDAIIWNLAARCRPLFGVAQDPSIVGLAKMSLNVIRSANAQIPVLRMPRGIGWGRAGRWAGHGIRNYASLG